MKKLSRDQKRKKKKLDEQKRQQSRQGRSRPSQLAIVGQPYPGVYPQEPGAVLEVDANGALVLFIQAPHLSEKEVAGFKQSFDNYALLEPEGTPIPMALIAFSFPAFGVFDANFDARVANRPAIKTFLDNYGGIKNSLLIYLLDGPILKAVKKTGLDPMFVLGLQEIVMKQLAADYSRADFLRYLSSLYEAFTPPDILKMGKVFEHIKGAAFKIDSEVVTLLQPMIVEYEKEISEALSQHARDDQEREMLQNFQPTLYDASSAAEFVYVDYKGEYLDFSEFRPSSYFERPAWIEFSFPPEEVVKNLPHPIPARNIFRRIGIYHFVTKFGGGKTMANDFVFAEGPPNSETGLSIPARVDCPYVQGRMVAPFLMVRSLVDHFDVAPDKVAGWQETVNHIALMHLQVAVIALSALDDPEINLKEFPLTNGKTIHRIEGNPAIYGRTIIVAK